MVYPSSLVKVRGETIKSPENHRMHRVPLITLFASILLGGTAAIGADVPPVAGPVLWLKADAPGDAVGASGHVSIWKNHATSAIGHAVQPQLERQPQLKQSGNGLKAVSFDGKDDFLHLPEMQLDKDFSIFMVIEAAPQTEGGSVWRGILCGDADAVSKESRQYAFMLPEGKQARQFIVQAPAAAGDPGFVRLTGNIQLPHRNNFTIVGFGVRSGKNPELHLREQGNLVRRTIIPGGLPDDMAKGYTLGQGGNVLLQKPMRHFRGQLAEIIIYQRSLPEAEALMVENYLGTKYRLPLSPHPPLEGLEIWIRPDLQLLPEGLEVVQLTPTTTASVRNDGLKSLRLTQPSLDERPDLVRNPGGARLRFADTTDLLVDKWKPATGNTMLGAVTDSAGSFRIAEDWPSIRAESKLVLANGDLHEWLGYARTLSPAEKKQASEYLTTSHQPFTDPRRFRNGRLLFWNGYVDQPYPVECRDGSWLCVMTTSAFAESGTDRTLVTCRSRDQGNTWSVPVANIEPPLLQQPSWGTLAVIPSGRVFAFYNLKDTRADVPGKLWFGFRYSDDHGATWSKQRHPLPLPRLPQDKPNQAPNGWSVCPPVIKDGAMFISFARFSPPGRSLGRGSIYCSTNVLTETDAHKIRWEELPANHDALRSESIGSNMQEEHILVPLSKPGHLYCVWRTEIGHPIEAYSRDGGRTWSPPEIARMGINGPLIRHPLACTMPVALGNGRFLLWHHHASGTERGDSGRPRTTVWLSAGQEQSGRIVWSYPELLLYDQQMPVNGTGMSYPGFLVSHDRVTVFTTDKMSARQFEIASNLLDGLWHQLAGQPVPLPPPASMAANKLQMAKTPNLREDGFTWHFEIAFTPSEQEQVLAELRQGNPEGNAVAHVVIPAGSRTLRLSLWDRLGRRVDSDLRADSLQIGKLHRATFIIEGGAKIIIPIVDGVMPEPPEKQRRCWNRLPDDFLWESQALYMTESGQTKSTKILSNQIFDRALTVSQVITMHQINKGK